MVLSVKSDVDERQSHVGVRHRVVASHQDGLSGSPHGIPPVSGVDQVLKAYAGEVVGEQKVLVAGGGVVHGKTRIQDDLGVEASGDTLRDVPGT